MVRLLLLLVFFGAPPCFSQEPSLEINQGAQEEEANPTEQGETEPGPEQEVALLPPPIAGNAEPENQAASEPQYKNGNPEMAFFEWPPIFTASDTHAQWIMAICAVLATFVSIYVAYLINRTLYFTKSLVRETEGATKAAMDSVAATEIAVKQNRAWLIMDGSVQPGGNRFSETGNFFRLGITLKNYGSTPANMITVNYEAADFSGNILDSGETHWGIIAPSDTADIAIPQSRENPHPGMIADAGTIRLTIHVTYKTTYPDIVGEYRACIDYRSAVDDRDQANRMLRWHFMGGNNGFYYQIIGPECYAK